MIRIFVLLMICTFLRSVCAQSSSLSDEALLQVRFDQKIGAQVPLDLTFKDETDLAITLETYAHRQPMILIMGYYGCPMLCTLVLNSVVENLRELGQITNIQYQVIFVSIDPKETPTLAAEKKQVYAHSYGGRPEDWHFLTGDEASIRKLADAIGFRYAYDSSAKEYAHPSGFVVLSPDGKISRYFSGVTYSAGDLSKALQDANANESTVEVSPLNLLCFHFAPVHGKYGKLVLNSVRAGGMITILALGCLFITRKHGRPR